MEIGNRIYELRKSLKLTQTDFAAVVNISRSNLSNIEGDKFKITDRFIADVCREYNVSKDWLVSGEGDMFRNTTREEEIAAFVGEALADESDPFKANLISILAGLDENGWKTLKDAAELIMKATKKEDG